MGLRAESGVTVYRSMKRAGAHNDVRRSPKNSERVRRFNRDSWVVFGFRRIIHPNHSTLSSSSSPLHSRSGKAFGLAKKHSSANSERIGASNAADGPATTDVSQNLFVARV
ncbi:hypothetical protein ALC62_01649 [Cyphomyrmex costatus]|uniref:Uncharacterized protein n=1 Tax=Cyphomyrmex costatus TaxID=456900 RepID=A0A195D3H3_9HYME|nr:hypothetical protein ALC62_01649 [Cyphomyrmex costatus]